MSIEYFFLLDVDGIVTDGTFFYSQDGKLLKRFGPDDSDALREISKKVRIKFVSADKKGFSISAKRISDMGFELDYFPTKDRSKTFMEKYKPKNFAYMGDSYLDVDNLTTSHVGIVPQSGSIYAKRVASYVTLSKAGERSVSEACFYLNHTWSLGLDLPPIIFE